MDIFVKLTTETKHCGLPIISSSEFSGNLCVCSKPVFKLLMVQVTVQTKFMLHTQLFAVWLCHVRCLSGLRPARIAHCYTSRTCKIHYGCHSHPQMRPTILIEFTRCILTSTLCPHRTRFAFIAEETLPQWNKFAVNTIVDFSGINCGSRISSPFRLMGGLSKG